MKQALLWVAGITIAAAVWVVSASWLYLLFVGRRDLFVAPYCQWIDAAPYVNATVWMKIYVVGSAAIPAVVLATYPVAVIKQRLRNRRPALYGRSTWAGDADMRTGGIGQSRSLF
jgi:hypothetical protein